MYSFARENATIRQPDEKIRSLTLAYFSLSLPFYTKGFKIVINCRYQQFYRGNQHLRQLAGPVHITLVIFKML